MVRSRPQATVCQINRVAHNLSFVQFHRMAQLTDIARTRRPSARKILVLASAIIIGLAIVTSWVSARPPSHLTAGLPRGWGKASSQFNARLRARFPVGSSANTLIDGLASEGFTPTWFEADGEYGAKRDESSFPCNVAARVFWRVGQTGTVSAVRGTYHEEGCL